MARAQKIEPPMPDVVLTLTWEEAVTLRTVVRLVGGHEVSSRRRDADAIEEALAGVGVPHDHSNSGGSIAFGSDEP